MSNIKELGSKKDLHFQRTFEYLKPICDKFISYPSRQNLAQFMEGLAKTETGSVNVFQQYILYPFLINLKSKKLEKKHELLRTYIEAMETIVENIKITNYNLAMQIITSLMQIIFDISRAGMVADVSEELQLSVLKCLTTAALHTDEDVLIKILQDRMLVIGQILYVSVHIAKLEKLRKLRITAINCVMVYTLTHPNFTDDDCLIVDQKLESLAMELIPNIMPGVLAGLQDVAMANDNPGCSVIVNALNAVHRIMCVVMNDKYFPKTEKITVEDFTKAISRRANTKVVEEEKKVKDLVKCSPEWYKLIDKRLVVITRSVISLQTHEHYQVRKELAVYCARIIKYCQRSLSSSVPIALEVLLTLSRDDYEQVADYCRKQLLHYMSNSSEYNLNKTMSVMSNNFLDLLNSLPRILNNIDSDRKLSALKLLCSYVHLVWGRGRGPPSAPAAAAAALQPLCGALLQAAALHTDLTLLTHITQLDLSAELPKKSPWCKLKHLDSSKCEEILRVICMLLGNAECAELIIDRLLEMLQQEKSCEAVYIINWMTTAINMPISTTKRVIDTYIEEDMWYLPLEVDTAELPITEDETLDVTVYNPRAWVKDSVPGLYEGAVETRYTDISYRNPRALPRRDPTKCATLREAQRNLVFTCLLTEGVGLMATKLRDDYQSYLVKVLCLLFERIGSVYDLQHKAGMMAICNIAQAYDQTLHELVSTNADYLTHQVTVMLKKPWKIESALQILSIVLEISDTSITGFLYGVVENVLVQSFDKYHQRDMQAYMRLFRDFYKFIRKWYNNDDPVLHRKKPVVLDPLREVWQYIDNVEKVEQALNDQTDDTSVEEMYKEDLKIKEDNLLDYDDKVTEERQLPPQYVTVTITVLKRCINFIASPKREVAISALYATADGLSILKKFEDELLPLVHAAWAPLVAQYRTDDFAVMKAAYSLFVVLADSAKDFVKNRAIKELLPLVFHQMEKCSRDSYLKDYGSAYRNSPAFQLQMHVLDVMPKVVINLGLEDESLEQALSCCNVYLSKKQPVVLQKSAVSFFQQMLKYDYGATWYHLRRFCHNAYLLDPPYLNSMKLVPVVGTASQPEDKDFEKNVDLIYETGDFYSESDSGECETSGNSNDISF